MGYKTYCDSYEKLKEIILKKNIEIFKKLDGSRGYDEAAKMINDIVVRMMDIEWENYNKPDLFKDPREKFFETVNGVIAESNKDESKQEVDRPTPDLYKILQERDSDMG